MIRIVVMNFYFIKESLILKKEFTMILGMLAGGATGAMVGVAIAGRISARAIREKQTYVDKHLAMFMTMNQWVKIKQEGKCIADYLKKKDINTIAIYGMSYMGQSLLAELSNSNIKVLYGIDKNAKDIYCDVDIYTVDMQLPQVDGVVVTSIYYYAEIEKRLRAKVEGPIFSLEEIVYEM